MHATSHQFASCRNKLAFIRRAAVVLGVASILLSCADEDRVLTARCQEASEAFATATFATPGAPGTVGGLSARRAALGTLFKLTSNHGQSNARWMAVHTLAPASPKISHEIYWNSLSVHVPIKTDLDGEELPEASRVRIESALLSGSAVVAWDVEHQAIADTLLALNADPKALRILSAATAQERYVVISSRLLARYVGLSYTPGGGIWLPDGKGSVSTPFVTPWTFRLGTTNFHSNYSCTTAHKLNSMANAVNARVPAVYFYKAIRYNAATRKVEYDQRSIDLDQLTATLRATTPQ